MNGKHFITPPTVLMGAVLVIVGGLSATFWKPKAVNAMDEEASAFTPKLIAGTVAFFFSLFLLVIGKLALFLVLVWAIEAPHYVPAAVCLSLACGILIFGVVSIVRNSWISLCLFVGFIATFMTLMVHSWPH